MIQKKVDDEVRSRKDKVKSSKVELDFVERKNLGEVVESKGMDQSLLRVH